MEARVFEGDDNFTIELTPESIEEAALLLRLSINSRKKLSYEVFSWIPRQTGTNPGKPISCCIGVEKIKRETSSIDRGKN